jgi:hypothetical protein
MRSSARLCLTLLFVAACTTPALGAWPNSPFTNRAMCTAAGDQQLPTSVSDGAGGAIVTWRDQRSGNYDIYAQHVLASGAVDPAWPANGLALCTAVNHQQSPTIVSDGAGGAIVTWQDQRISSFPDIYAQHALASGAVDPAWPANGRALCTAASHQTIPTITSDGAGGAIVTWPDTRSSAFPNLYAQHVLASGAVDPAWPADGQALCTAAGNQNVPMIVSDGAGGAIVTWHDTRNGTYDIYAQHVLASGTVDGAWPVDGLALCTAVADQQNPTIVSDGAGGALVTWQDTRTGATADIFAQHVLASGLVDGTWPVDGRGLCTAGNNQTFPVIVSDGAGGAIVTWNDNRSGTSDIYAQHVLASGVVDGAWPGDGRALCTALGPQSNPAIVSDGAGGVIVAWHDIRGVAGLNYEIYAQHVLVSGAVDGAWAADGRPVSTASGEQSFPTIVSDGAGGALIAWQDVRSGNYDIYAQRVARHGYLGTPEGEIVSVADVPADQGGKVKVSWNASYLELDPYAIVTSYRVYRSVPPNLAASMRAAGAQVTRFEDESESLVRPGALLTTFVAATTYFWEYLATVTADFLPNYSYLAPTAQDSTAAGAPVTAFMIQARTAGAQHWESLPMSGYSVDNLPPAAPAPFTGQYSAGSTSLHWNPNTEADLAGYRLYRGASAGFVPGPGNLVGALPDTGYVDPAGVPSYYKLTAVDSHGNESLVALLSPSGTVSVGDATPDLAFALPSPNPANARTTLQYTLARGGLVRLGMYDASGRLVRELSSGTREAGQHTEAWNLRDASGRTVGAGLYFARLETDGRTLVRRVAVTR